MKDKSDTPKPLPQIKVSVGGPVQGFPAEKPEDYNLRIRQKNNRIRRSQGP